MNSYVFCNCLMCNIINAMFTNLLSTVNVIPYVGFKVHQSKNLFLVGFKVHRSTNLFRSFAGPQPKKVENHCSIQY